MATFTYADAVKLLGGNDSTIVRALDSVLGAALLGGSALSVADLLSWFDAKGEFIRLSRELVGKVSGERGDSRIDRTHRLHAAHSVTVLVAFFEALDELDVPFTAKSLDLTRQRQLTLLGNPVATIHDAAVPLLTADQPYESFLSTLTAWYRTMGLGLATFVEGLAIWDELSETQRAPLGERLREELPERAVRRYEELLRRLAVDCPEVAFWISRIDAAATRETLGVALRRLTDSLAALSVGDTPTAQRQELALGYQAALNHPILDSRDAPGGLTIPLLKDSYIDPFFQVNDGGSTAFVAQKSWWDSRQVRTDMYRFITGYLTSPDAWSAPLLVLGDPGSGKSLLTKVLAARLPASDFLVVRVELRDAPADADVLGQIEHAIKRALKEDVSWPSLVRSAPRAQPVVLLDGFDELLQATGVTQTDYLTRIARFQRERADVGSPMAFVVTSRISVANRATLPSEGVVVRLTEFTDDQKHQWLDIWRDNNSEHFVANGLRPLDLATVQRYAELSAHPLLLLMLALYDAEGNPLQRTGSDIDAAELYEQLLTRFARREVTKEGSHRTEAELAQAIEDEFERLSIVAFAMFNRGSQWVAEADLDKDFAVFHGAPAQVGGIRSPLSAGAIALGRFFFVQRSRATRDSRALHTYEFLHATFGEYLVARHIWNVLSDLPNRAVGRRSSAIDDSELYSLLSYVPLSNRTSIIEFLVGISSGSSLGMVCAELFRAAEHAPPRSRFTEYVPAVRSMPERFAVYSANLLILTAAVGGSVRVSELCGQPDNVVPAWNKYTRLWKALLAPDDWYALVNTFILERVWSGADRDIELRLGRGSYTDAPDLDVEWWNSGQLTTEVFIVDMWDLPREAHFLCDKYEDFKLNALNPIIRDDGIMTVVTRSGQAMNYPEALLGLLQSGGRHHHEYLWAINQFRQAQPHGHQYSRGVFRLIQSQPQAFDLDALAKYDWIAKDPLFWRAVCAQLRIGRDDDDALLALLAEHWELNTAYAAIPEAILDAWLRMVESDFPIPPPVPTFDLVLEQTRARLGSRRPDLIRRADAYLARR